MSVQATKGPDRKILQRVQMIINAKAEMVSDNECYGHFMASG